MGGRLTEVSVLKREVIATGRNVDEAIEEACRQLGVDRDEVEVEVLEVPKKSFFGLKVTPAKVKVVSNPSKAQIAREYLEKVLAAMGVTADIQVTEQENGALIRLEGEDLGIIIGRRGETLDALQYLTSLVANRGEGDYFRVTIDSGNFREKREKTLQNLAGKIASQAIRTGRSVTLEPMNPYERRIIHSAIQEIDGVNSTSSGEEPHRCVVVSPTNPRRPSADRRGPRRSDSRGPRPAGNSRRGYKGDNGERRNNYRRPQEQEAAASDAPVQENRQEVNDAPDKPLYSKIEI